MLKKFNLIVLTLILFAGGLLAQEGSGTIKGLIRDESTGKPIFNVIATLKQNDLVKLKTKSDPDGKFRFDNVGAGTYEIEFRVKGYIGIDVPVSVKSEGVEFLEKLTMSKAEDGKTLKAVKVKREPPLINPSGPTGDVRGREQIKQGAMRDVNSIVATMAGATQMEGSGGLNIKGSSSADSYYYIDGQKVRGVPTLPKESYEEIAVILGGIPANYGDVTGGIVSITTRGPSAKFFGSAEYVTSGYYIKGKDKNGYDGKVFGLDKFGYNLFEGMISGPLLMKKDSTGKKTNEPLLGFMLTYNYTNQLDNSPLAYGGAYRVKKDVRDNLLANPLRVRPDGQVPVSNALFLTKDDFEKNPWRMNAGSTVMSSTGKIDVKLPRSMNLVFGASMTYAFGKSYDRSNSLLNFANNGDYNSLDYRGYVKFSQRFRAKEQSSSKIKSASYNLMIDYSRSGGQTYDQRYKYNAFNYGHVGTFTTTRIPTYAYDFNNATSYLNGYRDVSVAFTPDANNSELAATTAQYFNLYPNNLGGYTQSLDVIRANNGLINGNTPTDVYGLWTNAGTPYGSMGKSSLEQFRVTGSGSVIIGDHALTLGFEYEKRWDRSWAVNPIGLWNLLGHGEAGGYVNRHINFEPSGNDSLAVANVQMINGFKQITYAPVNSGWAAHHNGEYGGQKNNDNQSFFDYNLRNKLGLSGGGANSSYIDVQSLDPSLLSVNMFSPDELLNNGNSYVTYYGYDISGNRVSGKTSVDDYFSSFDKNNNYKRFVGAYQPTYVAGYIMDKFAINKLVFNVGVRVDVFDANQPTLKDPYLLYEARTVGEVKELVKSNPQAYSWVNIPSSVSDNYIVYVDNVKNPTQINGFRSGSQWYTANGNPTDKSSDVRSATGIAPWLLNQSDSARTISGSAFKMYTPQVNVMPRLAFSFPISDKAAFTAHYDILTIRPTNSITRFDPTDYQFISSVSSPTINNPSLKPKQTIDYEVGFQQVLTETSSIKISGFYREQRNDIQLVRVIDAYPNTYSTYGNIDFGTVKGMMFSYDLRRTNNFRMTANYTLQFAEGTGANSAITQNVTSIGYNFRYIFPYSYDIRHQINIVGDYRYEVGQKYDGPMIGKFELFKNTGLNVTSNIYSGSPYTAQNGPASTQYVGMTGTVNGSRLPWTYRLDIQLDRSFETKIKTGSGELSKEKKLFLNVYVRATNLFNKLNLLYVYPGTGSWKDDGFLAAAQNQNSIQNQLNVQSYINYYNMAIQNPSNISAPRTIRVGVRVDF